MLNNMDESGEWLICKYCKKNFHGMAKLRLHKKNKHVAQIRASLSKKKGRDSVTPTPTTAATNNNNRLTFSVGTCAGPSKIRPTRTTTITPVPRKRQKRLQDTSSDSSSSSDSDDVEYSRLAPEIFLPKSQSTSKAAQSNKIVSKPQVTNVSTITTKACNAGGPNLQNHNTSGVTTSPKICTVHPAPPQSVAVSQFPSLNKTTPSSPIVKSLSPPIIKSPPPPIVNKSLLIAAVKPPIIKPQTATGKPPAVKAPAVKPSAVKPPAVKPPAVKPPAVKPPPVKSSAVQPSAAIMSNRAVKTTISVEPPCPSSISRVKSPHLTITAPTSTIRSLPSAVAALISSVNSPPTPIPTTQILLAKSPPPPIAETRISSVKSPPPFIPAVQILPIKSPPPSAVTAPTPSVVAPISTVKSPPPPAVAGPMVTIKSSPTPTAGTTVATSRAVPKGYMPQNYQCAICHVYFITMPGMERHMKQHNNVILKVAFGCSVCKARFEHEKDRNEHLKVHMGAPPRFGRLSNGMPILPVAAAVPPSTSLTAATTRVNNVEVVELSPTPVEKEDVINNSTVGPSPQLQQNEPINQSSQGVHSNDDRDMKIIVQRKNSSQNPVVPVTETVVEATTEEPKNDETENDSDSGKPKSPLPAIEENASNDLLLCYICAVTFQTIQGLYKHILDDHTKNQETFTCTVCTKDFDSAAELDTHKKKYHVKICEHCGRCFTTTIDLNIHLRQEHNTKAVYACSSCGIGFHLQTALIMHYKLTNHT